MANTKTTKKLSDKLIKVNESYTVYMYDNGYMVEVSGRNKKGDYMTSKLMCNTIDEVIELVRQASDMERDN